MKIVVIYNRESKKVINLFGVPNREKYGLAAISRIVNALKKNGHQVISMEGDKNLIYNLEQFMPRVLKGELPGMVFNLSYGIQGQARYTHVPGILEMVGVPYVGSGPLAHSLALDKVVAKMLFVQNGLPTPEFAVLQNSTFEIPKLNFPLIVKPKNEAVSFGIKIVNNEDELRDASEIIFNQFGQDVLVEQYIEGREINIGLLGNNPPEAFVPAELIFGPGGPNIYTMEDKKRISGREIDVICPAQIDEKIAQEAKELSIKAFTALGCYDCARVDIRMDEKGNLYLLEINSLPSLGEHGSYVVAAQTMGLGFPALINRLVEVAAARYFGMPNPPDISKKIKSPKNSVFAFLTERRDRIEKRIEELTRINSRSDDPVGLRLVADHLYDTFSDVGLRPVREFTDSRDVWTWETPKGFEDGTLLIFQIDVPINPLLGVEHFRRDAEWLFGEGIGSSRASIVILQYALLALRHIKQFKKIKAGIVYYADEGRECEESSDIIKKVAAHAKQVLVLNPGNPSDRLVTSRRGQRKYRLIVEGVPLKLGQSTRSPEVMKILAEKIEAISKLNNRKARIAVSIVDIQTDAYPRRLPHRIKANLQASYPNKEKANELDKSLRVILSGGRIKWDFVLISDRPPMYERKGNVKLVNSIQKIAEDWDIPLGSEASLWPSAAGLVPKHIPVVCGVGPVASDLYTSREAVSRISIIQRSLLLAQFLLQSTKEQ